MIAFLKPYAAPVILILGILVAAGWFAYRLIDEGAERERAKQEKANAEFVVRANKGAVSFDTCDRAGGLYDFRRGSCQLPATVDGGS